MIRDQEIDEQDSQVLTTRTAASWSQEEAFEQQQSRCSASCRVPQADTQGVHARAPGAIDIHQE